MNILHICFNGATSIYRLAYIKETFKRDMIISKGFIVDIPWWLL